MSKPDTHIQAPPLRFEKRLSEILSDARTRSRAFSAPYSQLWEQIELMAARGKKLRPRLLIDAYTALGGVDERAAVDAACAMELLHMSLMIHDDLIDNDLIRRGEMNITGRFASEAMLRGISTRRSQRWGEASSILAGDLTLTMAHSLLAGLEIEQNRRRAMLDIFDDTVFESAAGEHYDMWLSMRLQDASIQDVLSMVEQKTAAYSFHAPLTLAATLAGGPSTLVKELGTIARGIGVIYQLRDDILGIFGNQLETGKSNLSDLREGKETLLIAHARSDASWESVAPLFGEESLSTADGNRLRRVIEESGALAFVESIISERRNYVCKLIHDANMPAAMRKQLTDLTVACNERVS